MDRLEDPRATRLLEVIRETLVELREPQRAARATLDSSLESDLGLDSLARVELLLRVEHAFGVTLPENTLQVAQTARDLLTALDSAQPVARPGPAAERHAVSVPAGLQEEPIEARTLIEVLNWHAARHGERAHIVLLSDAGEQELTYKQLKAGASAVAAGLQSRGLMPRQAVAIMLPTSFDYFYTYFGILLAGGIPVPIYPPARLTQIEEHVQRHAGILANAQAATLVTVPEAMAVARLLEANVPALRQVVTVADLCHAKNPAALIVTTPEDIAFIQYTSGSTGNPKGVVLTHANLLANIRAMAQAVQASASDVFVSWLPLYHDMGLIGAWLGSLYTGSLLAIMSPLAFLARPERWLWAIHRFRGTISAGPNFAYELCVKRIADAQLAGLDLSSWRLAFNGAEAVSPDTITRFSERFAPYGLRADAITPVYGLAESSVGLLFPPLGRGPLIDRIRREPFMLHGKALPAAAGEPNPLRFMACGRPLPGHELRIVDETGLEVAERVEGRLEFKGPSATSGYYRNPEQTKSLFHAAWLDTGDRAYSAEGDVFVTGRVKDIIIRGGRHIYPDEIEQAVGALPDVRKGCVAVFGSPDPKSGTERLVVVAETRATDDLARDALRDAVLRAALNILGEPPDDVIIAPPHTVLKTSSGKIRRSACRELYEAGAIGARAPGVATQLVRLALHALVPQARRFLALTRAILYAVYAGIVLLAIAALTWLVTVFIAKPAWAWAIGGMAARAFFRLIGAPLAVRGLENLPRGTSSVLVANHSSYLDGVALIAALPVHYRFVAKRELRDQLVAGVYLARIGAEFVERFDAQQSVEDANRVAALPAQGASIAFFPEGTFTRAPGLMPFHLGAFVAAAHSGAPVVPVAIRGTRTLLRGGQWFPRRGAIVVTICAPIAAPKDAGDLFSAALILRDAARAEILRHCGEPDAGAGELVPPRALSATRETPQVRA
ncbi:MAG: AMP-binding protein [Burkholderiales bacterium]